MGEDKDLTILSPGKGVRQDSSYLPTIDSSAIFGKRSVLETSVETFCSCAGPACLLAMVTMTGSALDYTEFGWEAWWGFLRCHLEVELFSYLVSEMQHPLVFVTQLLRCTVPNLSGWDELSVVL